MAMRPTKLADAGRAAPAVPTVFREPHDRGCRRPTKEIDRRGFLLVAGAMAASCATSPRRERDTTDGAPWRASDEGPLQGADQGSTTDTSPVAEGGVPVTEAGGGAADAATPPPKMSCTPPTLPIDDGGKDPSKNPAITPANGQVISDTHFRNWTADGVWPKAGAAAVIHASEIDPSRRPSRCRTMPDATATPSSLRP